MTVLENLEKGGYTVREPGRFRASPDRVHALFPVLGECRRQKAGTPSGGEQPMLDRPGAHDRASGGRSRRALARALAQVPGRHLREVGERRARRHDAPDGRAVRALGMSDRVYVLELGRNRLTGPGPAFLADPEARRLYLGG